MRRACLLGATALATAWTSAAGAQVSVPLPGGRPSQRPAPATPVPLPGRQPPASVPLPKPGEPERSGLPTVGQEGTGALPIGKYGRPDINPYERDIDMTVPLTYKKRSLGDLPVRMTFDDQLLLDRKAFRQLIDPLLSPDAQAQLTAALATRDRFSSDDLKPVGIAFEYDPSNLAVVVLTIEPKLRSLENLFDAPRPSDEEPDLQPAGFSAFMNVNVLQGYNWEGDNGPPAFSLNGAARLAGIVFEGDVQGRQEGFGGNGPYRVDRTYARLVYDQPKDYRRFFLGDLTPEVRGQQTFVQIGGVGVLRQRERFDSFRSSVLQSNRQLLLQQDSTVRILRNGTLYRELKLDAGSYDLSQLPLLAGSNDVQVEVRDPTGGVRTIAYRSYLDPIDLVPGDYEYAAYFGPTSQRFGRTPSYRGPVAFSGFYRKAFVNAPAFGVGLQASSRVQNLTGQTQYVVGNGGRFLVDAGISRSRGFGTGYSAGVSYDQLFDRGGLLDSFSIRADYISPRYSGLGNPQTFNANSISLSGQYTRAVSERLTLLATANYTRARDRSLSDTYRIGASANYYLSRRWSVRAGVDYSKFGGTFNRGRGIGFNLGLVFQPDFRQRFEARHDSATDSSTLSYLKASDNRIGSVGYGAVVGRDLGSVNAQGFLDYTGNRFDASISHASFGSRFSRFGEQNISSIRVGTAIAFADGEFGIGRRINDSFAIVYPHENLKGHDVVAGQSLANNEYISKSGALGGAVNGFLTSYTIQSVQYDVENPPTGYDVGAGVVRVKPPYRSGYKVKVGTDAFASAFGVLVAPNKQPIALASGRVTALDGKDAEPLQFFTNSVGRFAIQNLRPGVEYKVELFGNPTGFSFRVPADTTGLVDLKNVAFKAAE